MAAWTVCLRAIVAILAGQYRSTSDIHFSRDRLQMVWIATSTDATKMVQLKPVRDGACLALVGDAVSEPKAPAVLDLSVPVADLGSNPHPTARGHHDDHMRVALKQRLPWYSTHTDRR